MYMKKACCVLVSFVEGCLWRKVDFCRGASSVGWASAHAVLFKAETAPERTDVLSGRLPYRSPCLWACCGKPFTSVSWRELFVFFTEEYGKMKKLLCLVMVLLVASVAQAGVPIAVANQSFEVPVIANVGDASHNWNNQDGTGVDVITGWSYDYTAAGWPSDNDTGVWNNANTASPDGTVNTCFSRHSLAAEANQMTGPWQDLGYTIVAGETYGFSMDVRRHDADEDHAVSLTFNYHDASVRTEILENLIDITGQAGDTWETYSVSFTAVGGEDYIGKSLGIEFNNESVDDAWHSFDNAVVPEPATMMLLGLGSLALLKRRRA